MKKTKFLVGLAVMVMTIAAIFLSSDTIKADEKPGKVMGLKQVEATDSYVEIEWAKIPGAYYMIELSQDNTNFISFGTVKEGSTWERIKDLSENSTYYVRIKSYYFYTLGDRHKVYSDYYSDVLKVVTKPSDVKNIKQIGATISTATISWDKLQGADSYRVYKRSLSNDLKLLAGTTTKNSMTLKNVNPNEDTYYEVKAVKTNGDFSIESDNCDNILSSKLKLAPKKPSISVAKYYSNKDKVKVRSSVTNADGHQFELYDYKNNKLASIERGSSDVTFKNIKINNFYKIRSRAYSIINNKICYGSWSGYKYVARQPKLKVRCFGSKIKLSWGKVNGVKNYTIYVSTKKKSGYKQVAKVSKTTYTLSKFNKAKLNKNKTYYVYVVANKVVNGRVYKSDASVRYKARIRK